MIKKIEDLNYYELLEVSASATTQDIHKAYERIRRVYEPNSIALYSLFTPEETAVIHQRIEEAYRTLLYEDNRRRYDAMLRSREEVQEQPAPSPTPSRYQAPTVQPALPLQSSNRYTNSPTGMDTDQSRPFTSPHKEAAGTGGQAQQFSGEFSGPAIKLMREQRGLTLRNIADTTKISIRYLEYIEGEVYAKLPARPYLRGFLGLYAKVLGQEQERVVTDYIKRYDAAKTKPK
jgi:DnaJ-class molecular chaperone